MTIAPDHQTDVEGSSGSSNEIPAIPSSEFEALDGGYVENDSRNVRAELGDLNKRATSSARHPKTAEDFFEDMFLSHTTAQVPEGATDEEKQADRLRRLQDPNICRRQVFFSWPRDPQGKPISFDKDNSGKMAPNGIQNWGATLFDFLHVYRIPDLDRVRTTSTRSRLATWMKANGEDYAKDELELAEGEEDPEEIFPCDIAQLIEDSESMKRDGFAFVMMGGEGRKIIYEGFSRPVPFCLPSHFAPVLQQRIPLHLFPKTLVVHDPFHLLNANHNDNDDHDPNEAEAPSWFSKPDIVHTYRLELLAAGREKMDKELAKEQEDRKRDEALREQAQSEGHSSALPPFGEYFYFSDEEPVPGPTEPWIYALHEPPPLPTTPESAHLFLSPAQLAGKGHHSYAYHAELDLPRNLLVPDAICRVCLIEEALEIIAEEDADGQDLKWSTKRGEMVVKKLVLPEYVTSYPKEDPDIYVLREQTEWTSLTYEGPVRIVRTTIGYGEQCAHCGEHSPPTRTTVRVTAKLSKEDDSHLAREAENYQSFPDHFFEHWSGYNIVPPLQEPVPVGALVPQFYGYYVPDDDGFPAELAKADEQQEINTSQVKEEETTPGEVVGGHTRNREGAGGELGVNEGRDRPEGENFSAKGKTEFKPVQKEEAEDNFGYRSPIILMENCGNPIDIDALNIDDRHECASLFYRFHHAGWTHNSVAPRNVLFQPGPISEFPLFRQTEPNPRDQVYSFRLIDFGRSEMYEKDVASRMSEKRLVGRAFKTL